MLRKSLEAHRPPPNLTLSEWSDRYRRLPRETSADHGRWVTDKVPHMREIMDAISDPTVEGVVLKKSSQVAGSEAILNAIGYFAHLDPCPILMVMPKDSDVRKFSVKRLAPTIRDTPVLASVFVKPKSRDTGNTIDHKQFTGGDITLVGVNAPSNLASMPIRVVLSDEDDRQAMSSGDEGDPWELAWTRTTTYPNRKGVRVSTPTILGASRICDAFEATDKRHRHIHCPICGALHVIARDALRWDTDERGDVMRGSARLVCPHCHGEYRDAERRSAIASPLAQWIPTAPFRGWRGYDIWAAYSLFMSLDEIAEKIHSARKSGDPARIQVAQNTVFGEPYEGVSEKIDETKIAKRAEQYPAAVPKRVLVLTAGLDTQDDRVEAEVVGWGAGHESWSVDYRIFPGDPDIPEGQPGSPWDAVAVFLSGTYRHESGLDMRIRAAAIDTAGHKTQSVYAFCHAHRASLYPIKGKGGWDIAPVGNPKRLRFGKSKTRHIFLYTLGVDQLKMTVVGRLQIAEPGPGYCHFPAGRDDTYFAQLTAERLVTQIKANRRVTGWTKDASARNEALDTRVYAWGAFLINGPRLEKIAYNQKRQLALRQEAAGGAPGAPLAQDAEPATGQDATVTAAQPRERHPRRHRGSAASRISHLRSW